MSRTSITVSEDFLELLKEKKAEEYGDSIVQPDHEAFLRKKLEEDGN